MGKMFMVFVKGYLRKKLTSVKFREDVAKKIAGRINIPNMNENQERVLIAQVIDAIVRILLG